MAQEVSNRKQMTFEINEPQQNQIVWWITGYIIYSLNEVHLLVDLEWTKASSSHCQKGVSKILKTVKNW